MALQIAFFVVLFASAFAAPQSLDAEEPTTTPVPIIRQINNINDDGSYTFGYEAADGSFKLETRDNLGNVEGKFGYIDSVTGELKVVEYNAGNGTGFSAEADFLPQPPAPLPVPAGLPQNLPAAVQHQQPIFRLPARGPAPVAPINPASINIALDGFSEDADEDGFVDAIAPGSASAPAAPAGTQILRTQVPQLAAPQPRPQPRPQSQPQFFAQPQPQFQPQTLPQAARFPLIQRFPAQPQQFQQPAPQIQFQQPAPAQFQFGQPAPQFQQFAPQQLPFRGAPQFLPPQFAPQAPSTAQ